MHIENNKKNLKSNKKIEIKNIFLTINNLKKILTDLNDNIDSKKRKKALKYKNLEKNKKFNPIQYKLFIRDSEFYMKNENIIKKLQNIKTNKQTKNTIVDINIKNQTNIKKQLKNNYMFENKNNKINYLKILNKNNKKKKYLKFLNKILIKPNNESIEKIKQITLVDNLNIKNNEYKNLKNHIYD